jgi:NCS1 family nucleobase:cation symporter-1
VIFGEAIWDPVALLSKFHHPLIVLLSLISLSVATLTTNIAANIVSPANDFANLFPREINFVRGGIITAVLGIVMMPWRLLSNYGTYIYGWLIGYSGFLGPIAGVLIADYFITRKQSLNVKDLYVRGGEYEYRKGFNPFALIALLAGIFVAMVGLVIEPLRFLYDYAWFVGFAVAFVVYATVMKKKG